MHWILEQELAAALAAKLNKAGDVSTGPQLGPAATSMQSYVTYEQLLAGGKIGIRKVQQVGNAFVDLGAPVTDPLGLNRMAYPQLVTLFPEVAGLLPVFSMGYNSPSFNNVYSSLSISLPSLLPAIGGVELLNVPLTKTAVIPTAGAGTQLKFKASTGTWTAVLIYAFV